MSAGVLLRFKVTANIPLTPSVRNVFVHFSLFSVNVSHLLLGFACLNSESSVRGPGAL